MRLVIALVVPTLKISAIKRMVSDIKLRRILPLANQLRHQLRNPLAFGHEELTLVAAQPMSKLTAIIFSEGKRPPDGARIRK
jgi:hypothetical protein